MERAEREAQVAQAKRDLNGFLRDLEDLLDVCIRERPELVGREVVPQSAWPEIRQRFQIVRQTLDGLAEDGKEKLTTRKANQLNRELEAHGLTGEELAFKLRLFRRETGLFLDELAAQRDAEAYWTAWIVRFRGSSWWERVVASRLVQRLVSLRRAGVKIVQGRLKLALKAANVLLQSLGLALAFLPGVGAAVGAIGETKNALEVVLAEPDEAEKPPPRPAPPTAGDAQDSPLHGLGSRIVSYFW